MAATRLASRGLLRSALPAFLALLAPARAAPMRLSQTLGDSMVLQRNRDLTLWGFADPGVTVSVLFDGAPLWPPAVAGADGVWRQAVPAMPADADGRTHAFFFNASDLSSASLSDVVFGDVYEAGGQSNMSFETSQAFNASAEEATADAYSHWIRTLTVTGVSSPTALVDLNGTSQTQPWARVNSTNVAHFSAVGFFFARSLFDRLVAARNMTIPIGVISNAVGGTSIELWASEATLNDCAAQPDAPYPPPYTNGSLYNGMIAPFGTGPTAIAGWIFYQAEANAPPYGDSPLWYACTFASLIRRWRGDVFAQPGLWFGFVQLAPFIGPDGWENIRRAQTLGGLSEPNTIFSTMVDNGDPTSPFGSYHPRNKQLIGARLANAAVATAYGLAEHTAYLAPELDNSSVVFSQAGDDVSVTARFANVPASGLVLGAAPCPTAEGVPASNCADFSSQFPALPLSPACALAR